METVKQLRIVNEIIRDAFLLGKVNDQMGKYFSQRKENENEVRVRENTVGSEDLEKRGSNCQICKKKFRSRYHLNMHMPVHTGEKNYVCDICRKSYQQKWNLITHMARVHAKEKPFKCKDCGKAFGYSSHFKRHVKSHLVESMEVPKKVKERILNPYSCNVCGKSFDSKYRLELHIRKHYGIRPFMCDKCGMGFTTRRLINIHLSKHDVKEHVCDRCGLSFRDRREIMHHMKQVHEIVKASGKYPESKNLIPCEVCGKEITRASMKKHVNIHYRNRIYACRYCKKEFLESGQRIVHERKHTGEKPYLCDVCGKGHAQYGNLLVHRKRSHNMNEKPVRNTIDTCSVRKEDSGSSLGPSKSDVPEMECTDEALQEFMKMIGKWINKRFEESKQPKVQRPEEMPTTDVITAQKDYIPKGIGEKNNVLNQVKKRINFEIFQKIMEDLEETQFSSEKKDILERVMESSKEGETDSLRELLRMTKDLPDNKVIRTAEGKRYWFCWNCSGKFVNRHLLARHLLIHEPEENRPYKCDFCQKTFTQSNNYKEHLMSHRNENQFYCDKCGSGFRHKSHFNIHVRRHEEPIPNSKPRKFQCSHCSKRFHTNFHRNEHARTHTRERPYLCKICGNQFGALSTLNRHAQTHADVRYQCETCLKFFRQISSLKRHQKIHLQGPVNRVFCECGKSFSQRTSLRKHKMICQSRPEPVIKPFGCPVCTKKFLNKSDLKRHEATHNSEKKYKCSICLLRLKTEETFSRHLRKHVI